MGSYRLLLAVMVVAFHFGGWSPLTGRTAVFGFYCLSGYLMLLVLDRVYAHKRRGPLRFYANRFLRIYPVYLFYLAAMAIAIAIRGSADFVVDAGAAPFHLVPAATAHFGVADYLREFAFGNASPSAPMRAGDPFLVPQGWSLGIEMMFYVVAPALLLLGRRWYAWAGLACACIAYIAITIALDLSLDHYRYKSFFGSAIVFLYGAALYRFREHLPRLPRPEIVAIIAAILWLIVIHKVSGPATDASFYGLVALQMASVYAVVQVRLTGGWRRVDRWLGNVSYGVFVAQFLAAFVLLTIADGRRTAANPYPFGRVNESRFGHYAIGLTIVFAVATYLIIEHPLERVRDGVRGRELTNTADASARSSPGALGTARRQSHGDEQGSALDRPTSHAEGRRSP